MRNELFDGIRHYRKIVFSILAAKRKAKEAGKAA
jgi:hypothetical protein